MPAGWQLWFSRKELAPLWQPRAQRGQKERGTVCVLSGFSRVQLFATPWTVARQAPLFMGFSRPEYWSGSVAVSFSRVDSTSPVSCTGRWGLYH